MKKIVKQLRHGQITIPKDIREALGLEADDLLAITLTAGKLELEPVRVETKAGGSPWAKRLHEEFAPMRASLEGADEGDVNRAIDEALKDARAAER